jgi:Tfp pilus assembly protein PilV
MQRKQQGQGLLEVLISLILIAFGILSLIKFQTQLSLNQDVIRQQGEANSLATTEIETLSNYTTLAGYNSIASGSLVNSTISANTSYTVTWTITSFTNPTYNKIDVNVTWTDHAGNARNVRQDAIIAWLDPAESAGVM